MAKLLLAIEIAAPPDRVGVFFVPSRMPYWYGAAMRAEFTVLSGGADFAAGQKVQIRGWLGKREFTLTAVITEYSFARAMEWRFQDGYGVRGMQRWEIAATPGGSRVRFLDEYALPGLMGRVFDIVVTRYAVARRDREYLMALKRLAER